MEGLGKMRRAAGMSAVAGEPPTTQVSIPHRRLISQRLVGSPVDRVEEAVAWFGAVQAQDYLGAKWALA